MNDHLLAFADEAAAKADPIVRQFWTDDEAGGGSWNLSITIPGVFLWDPAEDKEEVIPDPAGDFTIAVKTPYDDKWRIMISLPEAGFVGHDALDLVGDRNTGEVLYSRLPNTLRLQPVFSGMETYFA